MATASHKDWDESQINRNKYYCLGGISKRITHAPPKTKEQKIREKGRENNLLKATFFLSFVIAAFTSTPPPLFFQFLQLLTLYLLL
jgi:hypothetical protein